MQSMTDSDTQVITYNFRTNTPAQLFGACDFDARPHQIRSNTQLNPAHQAQLFATFGTCRLRLATTNALSSRESEQDGLSGL